MHGVRNSASARCSASSSAAGVVVEANPVDRARSQSHRVGQAADAAHHRHRAVAQAVHLVEPARLEPRRHQEDVGARLDQVRQRLVEADARGDRDPGARRQRPPHVLVARLAGAEHDERGVELRQLVGERARSDRSPFWSTIREIMPISGRASVASSAGSP